MKKGDARTFGQDLMRGEHTVGAKEEKRGPRRKPNAVPGGAPMPLDRAQGTARKKATSFRDQDRLTALQKTGDSRVGTLAPGRNGRSGDGACEDGTEAGTGTSIFDPVLCEIAYRWFSPPGGLVLDPFAGGSVRGIVAAKLGRRYIGVDLSARQIEANRAQALEICAGDAIAPEWIAGDSRDALPDCEADFVFSCPPYADLERYSDDPADLSTLPYDEFRPAYADIVAKACARLVADSFACFVVGEVRDRQGHYIDFVGDTVQAFRDAGLEYYNEAILITAAGSLPIRVGRQFSSARKLGKTHQNLLVFVKGNGKRAAARCGPVEIDPALLEAVSGDEGGAAGVDAGVDIAPELA